MEDNRRGVFCATVILSVLGLGNVERVSFENITALKQEWAQCGYPPAEVYDESLPTYSISKCVEHYDNAIVKEVCDLYQQEVNRLCHTSGIRDVKDTATGTRDLLKTNLPICDVAKRVQLSPNVQEHLHGSKCASSCSKMAAPKVCRLLIILSLTGPSAFLQGAQIPTPNVKSDTTTEPPTTKVQTTTSTAAPETTTTAQTTTTTKPSPNITTPASKTTTTPAPILTTTTEAPTVKPSNITGYSQVLLYAGLVMAACFTLFVIYRRRKKILTCLREDGEPSVSPEDRKGRYRKLPHFERDVPSLDEVVKVKSFIY